MATEMDYNSASGNEVTLTVTNLLMRDVEVGSIL